MARHFNDLTRVEDVYQPHPVLAGIETMRWLPTGGGLQTVYFVTGAKVNIHGRWLLKANVLTRLTDTGLKAKFTPSIALDTTPGNSNGQRFDNMGAGPSTRAVSITIGYIVLLLSLLVIRLGRQHLFPADAPADTTPRLVGQPPAPPAGSPTRTEAPTAVETPTRTERPQNAAAAPAAATPTRPEKVEAQSPRSTIDQPETHWASAPVTAPPLAPRAAVTSGDTQATLDVDRTDTAIVPPPALPEVSAAPGSVGEAVEAVTLPRDASAPAVREIAPRDRVYQKESSALAQVLGHYEQAYDRLDASSAAAVWPSVDARALSRAFARLQTQDLNFGNCTFSVSASDAAARCAGVLRYARRIGDTAPKIEEHVWTIEFARAGETWQITKISAQ